MCAPKPLFNSAKDPGELVEALLREGITRWPLDRPADRPDRDNSFRENLVDTSHRAIGLDIGPANEAESDVTDPEDTCECVCAFWRLAVFWEDFDDGVVDVGELPLASGSKPDSG